MALAAMANFTETAQRALVVGLGITGISCVRYLLAQGYEVTVVDSRPQPPMAAEVQSVFPQVALRFGDFSAASWDEPELIVVSPGVALADLPVAEAKSRGADIVGDVELFARAVTAPVIAVTGSNGKSTVASLVGAIAREAGLDAVVAGNIGLPVLDALEQHPDAQLFVLELSSFQLETTRSLATRAAALLNVSEDHMDRYPDLASYQAAKARIFLNTELAVINRDDAATCALIPEGTKSISFGSGPPDSENDYGIAACPEGECLARGEKMLLPCVQLPLLGRHNQLNVLAAMALAQAAGIDDNAIATAVAGFSGLPHRMQWVANVDGVVFIDDSKGTNVGATCAALNGLQVPVVLIAGGDGKGADFSALRNAVADRVRAVVLIGRDAPRIANAIQGTVPVHIAGSMTEAVVLANELAQAGDAILLSPACASFDMFENYVARGKAFQMATKALQT